jgi:hypothetical protein
LVPDPIDLMAQDFLLKKYASGLVLVDAELVRDSKPKATRPIPALRFSAGEVVLFLVMEAYPDGAAARTAAASTPMGPRARL